MKAREVYQKAYAHSELEKGMLFYFVNKNGTVVLCNTDWMPLNKNYHETNIGYMETIEKTVNGFLFWSISPEGEEYIAKKSKEANIVFSTVMFMQK